MINDETKRILKTIHSIGSVTLPSSKDFEYEDSDENESVDQMSNGRNKNKLMGFTDLLEKIKKIKGFLMSNP